LPAYPPELAAQRASSGPSHLPVGFDAVIIAYLFLPAEKDAT